MFRILVVYVVTLVYLNYLYSQTCFGLLQDQLGKIKISKSNAKLLDDRVENSFYTIKAKIIFTKRDANIIKFEGNLSFWLPQKRNGYITFTLLHPAGSNFQYEVSIKDNKFAEEFFVEQDFLPGIYLWKAQISLEDNSSVNELFFILKIQGTKKGDIVKTVKNGEVVNSLEYIYRIDPKQNEKFIGGLTNLEEKTGGLYYFVYLLHKLVELTAETTYLIHLINKDRKKYINLKRYITTSYLEFLEVLKNLRPYQSKNLWKDVDNTMPLKLTFLINYYKKVYKEFKKLKEEKEYLGKTFEITSVIIDSLSRILW